jgi:hypothetical protein
MDRAARMIRRKEKTTREVGARKGLTFEKMVNNRIIGRNQEGNAIMLFGWSQALDFARQYGEE